jgi:hypothetical protein
MPAIPISTYNPNDIGVNEIAVKERKERVEYIQRKWNYYDGSHDKPLKTYTGERDDNIILNLCGRAVDRISEFIGIPDAIKVLSATEDAAAGYETMQAELDADYARARSDVPGIILSGMVAGHAYIKLYLDRNNVPTMAPIDPAKVTVFWDVNDTKQVLFYRLSWKVGDTHYQQDIVPDWLMKTGDELYPADPLSWKIFDYTSRDGTKWIDKANQDWPYPFAPIVERPHKKRPFQFYGVSQLHTATHLNDAVNFTMSNIGRIIKFHAHPKTFIFGAELDAKNSVSGYWDNLPTDAKVQLVEMGGDLQSSMRTLEILRSEFFTRQRVLDNATVKDKVGALTNFGVRMLFSEMIELRDELTIQYGGLLEQAFGCLLLMRGIQVPGTEAQWSDPLPVNRLEVLQAATLEKNLETTSNRTLTEEIGRDPDTEAELKSQEAQDAPDALMTTIERSGQMGIFG